MFPKSDQDRTISTIVCDISVCVFKEFTKDFRQEMTTMRCYFHRQVRNADRWRMDNCTVVSPVDSESTVITIGYVESIHVWNMTLIPHERLNLELWTFSSRTIVISQGMDSARQAKHLEVQFKRTYQMSKLNNKIRGDETRHKCWQIMFRGQFMKSWMIHWSIDFVMKINYRDKRSISYAREIWNRSKKDGIQSHIQMNTEIVLIERNWRRWKTRKSIWHW